MREIKFRAWDGINSSWFSDDEISILLNGKYLWDCDGISCLYENNAMIIEQFTGLHDKNGKKIYEGDIVMVINYLNGKPWEGHVHPCAVKAVPGGFELKDHWMHESLRSSYLEIIGNIHENPELLNEA